MAVQERCNKQLELERRMNMASGVKKKKRCHRSGQTTGYANRKRLPQILCPSVTE